MSDACYDAIIVGGGIGGLMCAAKLTRKGRRVAVLEQHDQPGGYCSSFIRNGHVLDSAVDTVCGLRPGTFFDEGLGLLERIEPIPVDPIRDAVIGERRFSASASVEAYQEHLAQNFPSERDRLPAFFDVLSQTATAMAFLRADEVWDESRAAAIPKFHNIRRATYQQLLDGHFTDPLLKSALSERCIYLGLPPQRVSAVTMATMLMSYFRMGAYRVRGGFGEMADALTEIIRTAGTVRLETMVRQIEVEDGRAVGVRLADDTRLSADHVVSNADWRQTVTKLIDPRWIDSGLLRSLARREASHSFVVVHLSVPELPADFPLASSIGYYPGGSVRNAFGDGWPIADDPHIGIGVSIPSQEDPTVAPPGRSIVALHYLCPGETNREPPAGKQQLADMLTARVGRLRRELIADAEVLSVATPHTLHRFTLNYGGAAFGWAVTPRRYRDIATWGNLNIENLSLVGHWTDYGPGVYSAAASGVLAAEAILSPARHRGRAVRRA
jgi:phytoene dehydrogenase-like protein